MRQSRVFKRGSGHQAGSAAKFDGSYPNIDNKALADSVTGYAVAPAAIDYLMGVQRVT
jgi:hypothetical protein